MTLFRGLMTAVMFVLLPASVGVAGETVTVGTASGRQFHGEVDPRSNDQSLWLRAGKPESFVRRSIEWSRVLSVTVGEKHYSADEFRRLINSPDWQWASDPLAEENVQPSRPIVPRSQPEDVSNLGKIGYWEPAEPQQDLPPQVNALHIDAYIANWDSDVEVDGLVVHTYPLDADGVTVPALGTLEVDLIGEGPTNGASGNPFPVLGRWSQTIRPEEMGVNGAVLRLPFQWIHPDFASKWNVGSFGMVHARLSVGGQGVFEDTAAFTRIRPYSPVRDRMQQLRERRFWPGELTSYPFR